ncbi:MAG: M20/M25/M40 family metallo-hydrolase [Halanaerobiales bacterium]|nr:M20/M25/M40 family metallo-hydrolase [Halanaerobiales bacterium]
MEEQVLPYINKKRVKELLSQLVKINSPFWEEDQIIDYTYTWFKAKGIPVEYHLYQEREVTGYQGKNIVGQLLGQKQGPLVVLNGHLDTVNICEGWTRNPLGAEIEGDRLYGVGALDMKGGCAAMMLAIEAFAATVEDFHGGVLYTLVSGEEGPYGLGTDALLLEGYFAKADLAIVPEPSGAFAGRPFPCLCLGARGGWKYTITVKGRSAHAANPTRGINAISEAAKLLLALEKTKLAEHPQLGSGSISVLDFEGGGQPLSVPDRAAFSVFRHVIIGEDQDYLRQEVEQAIVRAGLTAEVEMNFRAAPHPANAGFKPYLVSKNNPYTRVIKDSIKTTTGREAGIAYFPSVGDYNYLASRAKLPTYVIGPAGANYHRPDEYVELESVVQTARIIYDFLKLILVQERGRLG